MGQTDPNMQQQQMGGGMPPQMGAPPQMPQMQGPQGMAQGPQGVAQGGIGAIIAELLGALEGMNRSAQGGMEPNAMTQAAGAPSMTSMVNDATGLGKNAGGMQG